MTTIQNTEEDPVVLMAIGRLFLANIRNAEELASLRRRLAELEQVTEGRGMKWQEGGDPGAS